MLRIPEPELMTLEAQAIAYAEADFSEPHSRCIALLQQVLPTLAVTGVALDLGCGPADITLRFAKAFPQWQVDGLDGAAAMLKYGEQAVQAAGLSHQITLQKAYLPHENAPRQSYDLIFSNSLLHHLADPQVLWTSVHRWAKPTGHIFVMDLLRPESPGQAAQLVNQYAAQEPDILRHDFYHSLLAAYRIDEVQAQLHECNLAHLQVKPMSDRHFIVWGSYRPC